MGLGLQSGDLLVDGPVTTPTRDDAPLRFEEAVMEIVAPYLLAKGFRVSNSEPDAVRFASSDVRLVIGREDRSFELYLLIGPADPHSQQFELASAVALRNPAAAGVYRDFAATTPEGVRHGLERLVQDMNEYCAPALAGDLSFFEALRNRARDHPPRWLLEQERGLFEREASAAMDRRDWAKVASLYDVARHELNNLDRKRMEIAQRHLALEQATKQPRP